MEAHAVEKAIFNSTFDVSNKVMYAVIYEVIVLTAYKNNGIDSGLVSNITKQCKDGGVFSAHLFAVDGTKMLYNKLGFQARPPNMSGMRYEGI